MSHSNHNDSTRKLLCFIALLALLPLGLWLARGAYVRRSPGRSALGPGGGSAWAARLQASASAALSDLGEGLVVDMQSSFRPGMQAEHAKRDSTSQLPEATAGGVNLRIVTYNIHHGADPSGRPSMEEIASLLESLDADIIVLQEVDRRYGSRSGWLDQAQELADRLSMQFVFGTALERRLLGLRLGDYGNLILSPHELSNPSVLTLPRQGTREDRVLIGADVKLNGTSLRIYTTHLGLDEGERAEHAGLIRQAVASQVSHGPFVLAGDFNAPAGARELSGLPGRSAAQVHGITHPSTFPAPRNPGEPLVRWAGDEGLTGVRGESPDQVFLSEGLVPLRVGIVPVSYSDHMPLVVDVQIGGTVARDGY